MPKLMLYIKQCPDQLMWYHHLVGKLVTFYKEDEKYYWSREDNGYSNVIRKEDAEIFNE